MLFWAIWGFAKSGGPFTFYQASAKGDFPKLGLKIKQGLKYFEFFFGSLFSKNVIYQGTHLM